ncbi:caspase family protein [Streptomyces coeruleorubidus]|uniref:caspase family protein n=1 Tax=Streptomyces coeruleorubidus TaxID=116188 RepID=UPI0036C25E69
MPESGQDGHRKAESGRVYRALLIGNSEYPDDSENLRPLLGPPTDVRLLHAALTAPGTGLHLPRDVLPVLEETTRRIQENLAEFFESALPHEQLLLYYSGHGRLDLRNRLRLCGRDTTVVHLRTRSVSLGFINELIDDCAARSIIVILDCCFSGAAATKGADPAAQLAGRGRFVMTSSSHVGTSADARKRGEASPFTRHLVSGLESGADGRDGYVTTYELYRYVHDRLQTSGQIPHMKAEASVGAIPLARRQTPPPEPQTAALAPQVTKDPDVRLNLRPTFTDPQGNRVLLATDSDFTGVLHVSLPQRRMVLTTHRDQIASVSMGMPVTARLLRRARISIGDLYAEVTGELVTDLRARTSDGAVSFVLPDGAGTVEWTASQVRSFSQARSEGRWPGSPLTPLNREDSIRAYLSDHRYQQLATGLRAALGWTAACAVLSGATAVLVQLMSSRGFDEMGALSGSGAAVLTMGFLLLLLISLVKAFERLLDTWRFLGLRSMLRKSAQSARPMLMLAWMETVQITDGIAVYDAKRPWAWLWAADTEVAVFATEEVHGVPRTGITTSVPPALTVPIHGIHREDIAKRLFSGDRLHTPVTEHVEVLGTPDSGHWVAIRSKTGMLWPRGKTR